MGTNAFLAEGQFWRGNIHTHSTRSDGVLAPADVCRRYREAGYDFLCLSDHFMKTFGFPVTDARLFRTNSFTTIAGAELHAPANSRGEIWHILAAGLPDDFAPTAEDETGVQLAARARAAGAFVGIAHPQWSGLSIEDGRAMALHAHAVEIYNHGCAIESAWPDGFYLLDELSREGHRLNAYAADDAHFRYDDSFGGWMMVKAEANEPAALVEAMKRGDFYSSQGPEIQEFAVANGEAYIACTPAAMVALVGGRSRAEFRVAPAISEIKLPTRIFDGDWFRLVVRDDAGKMAWSNPVWLS